MDLEIYKIERNDKVYINGKRAKNLKYFWLKPVYSEYPKTIFTHIEYYFGTLVFEYFDKNGFPREYFFETIVYDFGYSIDSKTSSRTFYITESRY